MSKGRSLKRKSDDFIYELSDSEVSQIENDMEINQPEAKMFKPDPEANDAANNINSTSIDTNLNENNTKEETISLSSSSTNADVVIEVDIVGADIASSNNETISENKNTHEVCNEISSSDQINILSSDEDLNKSGGDCEVSQSENNIVDEDNSFTIVDVCDSTDIDDSENTKNPENLNNDTINSFIEVDIVNDSKNSENNSSDDVIPIYDLESTPNLDNLVSTNNEDENLGVKQIINEDSRESGEIKIDDDNEINLKSEDNIKVLTVTYHSEEFKNRYFNDFVRFLSSFKEFEILPEDLKITVSHSNKICGPASKTKHKKRSKKKKNSDDLFTVDASPFTADCRNALDLKYSSKFTINEGTEDTDQNKIKISQICFNCDENHALRDCPLPRNFNRINKARQNFKATKSNLFSKRYHLEEDQKYSNLKPGKISDKLRKALGLRKDQIPHYIYGMRILGYPPGWLQESKIVHSNLAMFDIHGKNVQTKTCQPKNGLDPDKIIEYSGFNVPLSKHTKDEYKNYNVPRFSKDFSKENMIEHYKKLYEKENDIIEICDMDLDDKEEFEEPVKVNDQSMEKNESINNLELKRKELLHELEDGDSSTSHKEPNLSESVDISFTEDTQSKIIKSSNFGTPILKSCSPFSALPKADNFSKGVSPVINFENLPNSTGKYEQMP